MRTASSSTIRVCSGASNETSFTASGDNASHRTTHAHLSTMTDTTSPRLTSLSHGGGCGCKIAPGVLAELLKRAAPLPAFPDLLVGNDTADDAAVYRLNDEQAIVATTDFFMPIVDDPFDFGRIAATNALSDVYAMGGKPILALALVGMPINVLPHEVIAQVLKGGEAVCAEAGIPVAGGHSIDSVEPIYGLAAIGIVHPSRVKRNAAARAGDVLVLGKPLGVGVLSAALKKDKLDAAGYAAMIAATTKLNRPGAELAQLDGVHALTDVTGFGLLGHALELARGSGLTARIRYADLPWLPQVREFVRAGIYTGASGRNWNAYGADVTLGASADASLDEARALLTDPQTSGGLLVSCAPEAVNDVLAIFRADGFDDAAIIGEMVDGASRVDVT
ncbi:selenophosphate synthetase [Caballeronia peredens]|nr:selenophosphate synthetase [Caballeronia peredens]